jgi:hypothetical protein
MENKIAIYAKRGSMDRVLMYEIPNNQHCLGYLNEKYGGDWAKVENFQIGNILKFTGLEPYLGFDGREDDNYLRGNLVK